MQYRALTRIVLALAFTAPLFSANLAQAQTSGTRGFNIANDKPVQIEGDRLEVLEDRGIAIFDGNVSVVQGSTVLRTGKLTIHYVTGENASITGSGEIERLEAENGVNIQDGTQIATGDQGTYNMASETLVLTGKRVTLSEDGNIATGCKLTVTMGNGRARLEGCSKASRPTVLIQPRSTN